MEFIYFSQQLYELTISSLYKKETRDSLKGNMCFYLSKDTKQRIRANARENILLFAMYPLGVSKLSRGPVSGSDDIRAIGLMDLQHIVLFLCRNCGQMRAPSLGCLGNCSIQGSMLPSPLLESYVFSLPYRPTEDVA